VTILCLCRVCFRPSGKMFHLQDEVPTVQYRVAAGRARPGCTYGTLDLQGQRQAVQRQLPQFVAQGLHT